MTQDTGVNALGWIGRLLTLAGYVWLGLFFLGGALPSQFGLDIRAVAGFGGIIPAFLLLGAGRALRKRSAAAEEMPSEQPQRSTAAERSKQRPTSQPESRPEPRAKPKPKPIKEERTPAARSLEEVLADMEQKPRDIETEVESEIDSSAGPAQDGPKTSAEMLEEARKRWSSRPGGD